MNKEKIILKWNSIKDYNNQLEKILVNKKFSEDAKNLLLSMLYNIENAYSDYKLVKVNVDAKNEILQEILDIIEFDCYQVDIIQPKEKDKVAVIKSKKKVITYINTKILLYLLYLLKKNEIKVSSEDSFMFDAIKDVIEQGRAMNYSEIIRDFDGWAWNINIKEIENVNYNFVYQIINILLGHNFWQTMQSKDFIKNIKEQLKLKYDIDLADDILILVLQIIVISYSMLGNSKREVFIQRREEYKRVFEEMDNKEVYFGKIVETKKKLDDKISTIEKLTSDDRALKKEYIKRNEKLDLNNRIFSISDLEEILEKEKKSNRKEITELAKRMKPMNYLKEKSIIETNIRILDALDSDLLELKTKLINLTLKALQTQIAEANSKEEITNIIYILRYFSKLYISQSEQIVNIFESKDEFDKTERELIEKACKLKVLNMISRNIETNYKIIKMILKADIINLQNLYLKFEKCADKITLKVYDEINNFEDLKYSDIEELSIKFNKKFKLFL